MTEDQIAHARHAGLPNDRKVSYRNHFVAGPGHSDYQDWLEMVEARLAKRRCAIRCLVAMTAFGSRGRAPSSPSSAARSSTPKTFRPVSLRAVCLIFCRRSRRGSRFPRKKRVFGRALLHYQFGKRPDSRTSRQVWEVPRSLTHGRQ